MIKLIVFLGNPTEKFQYTRHNVPWLFSDYAFSDLKWSERFQGLFSEKILDKNNGRKMMFLKPTTFMNDSGKAVKEVVDRYKLLPSEILVIHDEIDLPFGTVGLKNGGGLNGHNGLRSIVSENGFDNGNFWRFRFGVSRPDEGSVYDWVLGEFSVGQLDSLQGVFERVKELFEKILSEYDMDVLLLDWKKVKVCE